VAVPDFQTLMLPTLSLLGKPSPRASSEVRDALAVEFALTQEDLAQLLPSGKQTTFSNRVAWAHSYLKQASLVSSPKRGVYEITERGRSVLAGAPKRIDIGFLAQYPEFQAFRQSADDKGGIADVPSSASVTSLTPDEEIRAGYERLRASIASQLLDRVKAVTPAGFEQLVVDVLVALGYGGSRKDAAQVVGRGGDEGIGPSCSSTVRCSRS
jgi:restriction system protein